LLSNRLTCGC